jgi:multidrug efflux pump subunit AcrA (membrane-fusion protein)
MSTVWVLVNVYQNDLASVRIGDAVDITTDAYPDIFHGKISYVADALDPTTRTLQARIVTENPGYKLKKDMYVTANVHAGALANALTVPDAAVLRDTENQPFVYVQVASNQFARRLVKIGDSQDGRTLIQEGLKEGEDVVGDGSLFLQFKNSLQHKEATCPCPQRSNSRQSAGGTHDPPHCPIRPAPTLRRIDVQRSDRGCRSDLV